MTPERSALIRAVVVDQISECEHKDEYSWCQTHGSRFVDTHVCNAMIEAIDVAEEAVLAVLTDLHREVAALPIVEPQYPAIHDAVDRGDVLDLIKGS